MSDLPGEASIECKRCKSMVFVSGADIYVESTGGYERGMGTEEFYHGATELTCPNCENNIEISYEASEYPIGMLNHSDVHVSGGTLINGFGDIDVAFGDEIYTYEEESQLYLPEEKKIITNLCYGSYDLISQVSKKPEILHHIEPRQFEELIANIFSKYGFNVELTKQTRDGGKDIIAIRSDLGIRSKYIIECKRYAIGNPVRVDLVRNLYGVQAQEGANKSVLVTTSHFTPDAKKFADSINTTQWAMDLKEYEDIVNWVKDASRS